MGVTVAGEATCGGEGREGKEPYSQLGGEEWGGLMGTKEKA